MTEVAFHFNATDKLEYACRLLRKAVASSAQVVVSGGDQQIKALDTALWSFSSASFIPHCVFDDKEHTLAHSPVVLVKDIALPQALPHHHVLLNLGNDLAKGFEAFERIIEIVTHDEDDKSFARLRWKHYADRGYPLQRHDLSAKLANA
jgi:DNA polymerase-3 subunit chi